MKTSYRWRDKSYKETKELDVSHGYDDVGVKVMFEMKNNAKRDVERLKTSYHY